MPLWTALGSLFMPLGIAFLIFVSRNRNISKKLGLISAKANLLAYAATDWPTYLGAYGQLIAAGGFFLFILVVSWMFGREFPDRHLKRPARCACSTLEHPAGKIYSDGSLVCRSDNYHFYYRSYYGRDINLPGGSVGVFLQGGGRVAVTACLVIIAILPFAFFACAGRGYLLPIGAAVLTVMMMNLVVIAGWASIFPGLCQFYMLREKVFLHLSVTGSLYSPVCWVYSQPIFG